MTEVTLSQIKELWDGGWMQPESHAVVFKLGTFVPLKGEELVIDEEIIKAIQDCMKTWPQPVGGCELGDVTQMHHDTMEKTHTVMYMPAYYGMIAEDPTLKEYHPGVFSMRPEPSSFATAFGARSFFAQEIQDPEPLAVKDSQGWREYVKPS
eukprot:TRINITY_DN34558_c0_g1_i1.p1 TRINITY_DN34558_c0_g1~~TRINITY_DN34558_c0_g1_i1.p1  ORF type:complete len:152 (+),score=11.37 TRINITY_DN34558_c0_g1_i1:62-517(+)